MRLKTLTAVTLLGIFGDANLHLNAPSLGIAVDAARLQAHPRRVIKARELADDLEPGLYADGGYQTEIKPCVSGPWTFKVKITDTENEETVHTGCISMEEKKPYPFFIDDPEGDLVDPQHGRTDTAMWCPVDREVYNPTPLRDENNKFNWGYCLDLTTSLEPTSVPTEQDVPNPGLVQLLADGGFQTEPVPCLQSWRYKNNEIGVDEVQTGCISFSKFKPWPQVTEDDDIEAGSGMLDPTDSNTNKGKWCATRDPYNPFPKDDDTNKKQWGYCLERELSGDTNTPTTSPVTGSPTTAFPTAEYETQGPSILPTTEPPRTNEPTGSEGTNAPTTSSEETSVPTTDAPDSTSAPTQDKNKPDDSGNPQSKQEAGDDNNNNAGKIAGITIAVILVAVAVVLALLFAQSVYKKRQEEARSNDPRANDIEKSDNAAEVNEDEERKNMGIF